MIYVDYFFTPASPVLALIGVALLLIAWECLSPERHEQGKTALALVAPTLSILCVASIYRDWPIAFSTLGYFGDPIWLAEFAKHYRLDPLTVGFFWAINIFLFLTTLFIHSSWEEDENRTEVFVLLQFIAAGMMLLVSADSLLMVFTALELLSLPTYILVGVQRRNLLCSEAALKYFLFGSFATVILLFGIALLYAQFGTLSLPQLQTLIKSQNALQSANPFLYASIALFAIGVGFKVGTVPFHMWLPDTYEGAPAAVTGFMGSAVKLAGFGLAIRLFWGVFLPQIEDWGKILAVLAVLTMFVGNLAALAQENLKRLLAYSSIAHAGYLLLGIAVISKEGPKAQAMYYYLITYGLMFLGFFGVLALMERGKRSTDLSHLSGMGFSQPLLGGCLAIFALSAAGIPPTAGFLGKYFIFLEVVKGGGALLVTLAVIATLIGITYYLRILVVLYMKESTERVAVHPVDRTALIGIVACALCLLYFGLVPTRLGM